MGREKPCQGECMEDLLCCVCKTPTLSDAGGHMIHVGCKTQKAAVSPAVEDISPEERERLNRQAEEEGVPF